MKQLVCTNALLFAILIPSLQAQSPAPLTKQLQIGCPTYSSSSLWNNSALRDWYAERYCLAAGSGGNAAAHIAQMKAVNPNLKAIVYQIFYLSASDTNNVKAWCAQKGYDFEQMVLRVKNTSPADSVRVRIADIGSTGFARWVTTQPGGILLGPGFTDAQTRFCWDYRNPLVGEYLGERWKEAAESIGYDGVIVDEETLIGYTNNATAGIYPPHAPFRDLIPSLWAYGSPYSSFTRNWTADFDLEDPGTTHSYVDIRDSLRRARNGWMGAARAILDETGLWYAPNFAALPVNHMANWYGEGIMAANLAGTYIMGEYSYFSPSANGTEGNCNVAVAACHSIRDSNINLIVGWIRMGQFEMESGITFDRSKMNGLGMYLDCLFPGKASYIFMPSVKNGQVDYSLNRTVGSITADDTTTMWANAWGKYFGKPLATRDTTFKGTDPVGQSFTLHRIHLMDPNDTTKVQTVAVGRYCRGSNNNQTTTRVTVNLGGAFYELQPNGTYGPQVTTTGVANSEWRIFVADTILANQGPQETEVDVTPPAATIDLAAATGTGVGEVLLSWTAPGDDGNVGTVSGYELRFRDSSQGPVSQSNFASSRRIVRSIPALPAGTAQNFTLGTQDSLLPGKLYHFAFKSFDDAGNNSAMSNAVSARSKESPNPGDTTPPTPITNLAGSSGSQASQIVLNWTAPADQPGNRTIHGYQLRYRDSLNGALTPANFDSSMSTARLIPVGAPASSQTITLDSTDNLVAGHTYYLALKSFDSAGNYSAISNIVKTSAKQGVPAADTTPPAPVRNFSAVSGSNYREIVLSWIASGDDDTIGVVSGYIIKLRDSLDGPITSANFDSCRSAANVLVPSAAGTAESLTIGEADSLVDGHTYFFAIKCFDEADNFSPMSQIVSAIATPEFDGVCDEIDSLRCEGSTGNLNCHEDDMVDITDLSILIDYMFVSFEPPCCFSEANIDGRDGEVPDIADLTNLIEYLYIGSVSSLGPCPVSATGGGRH